MEREVQHLLSQQLRTCLLKKHDIRSEGVSKSFLGAEAEILKINLYYYIHSNFVLTGTPKVKSNIINSRAELRA